MSTPSQTAPTSIRFWDKDGVRILSVSGPLTISSLFAFQEAWRGDTSAALVFDLSEVPYADSAAVGSIVNAHVSRQNAGRTMSAVACERVQKLMQITKVASLFPVFWTVQDAIDALKENPAGR